MDSEHKLVSYINTLLDMNAYSLLLDRDLKIIFYSDSFHTLIGRIDNKTFFGMHLLDVYREVHDEAYVKEAADRLSRIVSEDEDEFSEDDTIVWPTGIQRIYRIMYKKIIDENGGFIGVAIVSQDVTDLRLEEAERRVFDILFTSTIPCLVWDENGDIVTYNEKTARFFGMPDNLTPEEFNKVFFSLQPTYQPDGQLTEKIRKDCVLKALRNGFSQTAIRLAKSDGTTVYFLMSLARVPWVFDYRLVVYYYDQTDIIVREAKIKEANERIRLMLDSNPMTCLLREENNVIIDCNQAALDAFGVTDKAEFCNVYYSFTPEYQPDGQKSSEKLKMILKDLFETGETKNVEWSFRTAAGEPLPMVVTFVRIQWDGRFCCLSYSHDLREIKEREQQLMEIAEREHEAMLQKEAAEMANAAKSQFLANMSHEIRTPMNAVLGMTELLLHENLNKRQHRYVVDMKTSAVALLGIIDDILDVSKIQSGKLNLVPVHYDFDLLIDNIGSMTQFLVDGKGIAFRLTTQEHPHLCLYGDDVRLRQVLLNLIGNAVKFTNEGYVQLAITIAEKTIRITVSDTGIGIQPENLPMLFDAFEQVDVLKNRSTKGTGLGLTIARSIIEMMGGEITVESVYGRGSSFHVEIPKIPGDETLIHHIGVTDNIISAPEAKILVVDDNATNLNVATGLLRVCKINADTAMSGEQAIEMIQNNMYDIVFMDHRMPGMSGTETTIAIRKMGITVPIIALTASAVVDARETMLAAGMDDYLSKPIVKSELLYILKKWIPPGKITEMKHDHSAVGEGADEEHVEFWKIIEQISGLDLSTGLNRVDGQWDVFKKTLKLMMQEIEKSEKNLIAFLSAGDMDGFRIEVHGIKGSLANIGAMELSIKAYELETASRDMDTSFCVSHLPGFLEGIIEFNMDLKKAFTIINHEDGQIQIPPGLPLLLINLVNAFDTMDLVLIDKELEGLNLMELSGSLKEKTELIKDSVMMMDYEMAKKHIQEVMSKNIS